MKIALLIPTLLLLTITTYAQSLRKYPIDNSGCSVYCFCDATFKISYSEDSAKIYKGECKSGDVSYGIICVRLHDAVSNLDDAENLMISYLDYLKSFFDIAKAVGYGKGHRLSNNENTRGVIDYWQDKETKSWKVKAWTDGRFMGILYAFSKQDLPETKVNVFLDSFRLPE